jgi:hypothetical protein
MKTGLLLWLIITAVALSWVQGFITQADDPAMAQISFYVH